MIDDLVQKSDFATGKDVDVKDLDSISFENSTSIAKSFLLLKTFQKKNLNW
jgi:methylmalonyl-CoA mutase